MKAVRFIHTSDVHLDTSFSGAGFSSRLGGRKREAIRATFRRILEDARRLGVDLVLIAGDLFEHDRITPDTIEFLKQQFEGLGNIPVFISPGNHDPYLHGSPYCEESWPDNVHIFCEEEFRSVPMADIGVRVTGFAFNRTQVEERIFLRLPPLPRDTCNLVLSHGSDLSCVPKGKAKHGPFTIEEIAGKNVHYLALGHYHQQRLVADTPDGTQAWYSGIPEGRMWDEEGPCAYLLGEITSGGIRVESRACNQYPFCTLDLECDGFSSREQILDAILEQRGKLFGPQTILRVRLQGALDTKLDLSFAEMEERLSDEVLHIAWDNQTYPALDYDGIARERTLRGRFVKVLNERITAAGEEERRILERARLYGVQALLGREVRLL